jgi:tetratricopeptide (TPR) repeat protein
VDQLRFEAAIESMSSAIAAEPARGSLHAFQGQLLEAVGRRSEARAAFVTAHKLDPQDPVAAYLFATRSNGEAALDWRPIVATLLEADERRQALPSHPFVDLALVRDLSAQMPQFAPARYAGAFGAFAGRRFHESLDLFRELIAQDPLIADMAAQTKDLLAGAAALRDGNTAAAVMLLESAVAMLPESSEAHRVLGVAYRRAGTLDKAVAQFEIAMRIRPDDERSRVALGTTLAEAGKLADAERELTATLGVLRSSGAARWALADVLEKQSRGTEAVARLEEAAALPVVAGRVHLLWRIAQIAHAYHRDVDYVVKITTERARLVPNEPHAHKDLGLAYYRGGRDDEAVVELLMTVLLGHEDAELLGAIGEIHFNAGRLERAEAALRRAAALDPNRIQVRYVLARTLQQLGHTKEAVEHFAAYEKLRSIEFEQQRVQFERGIKTGDAQ